MRFANVVASASTLTSSTRTASTSPTKRQARSQSRSVPETRAAPATGRSATARTPGRLARLVERRRDAGGQPLLGQRFESERAAGVVLGDDDAVLEDGLAPEASVDRGAADGAADAGGQADAGRHYQRRRILGGEEA